MLLLAITPMEAANHHAGQSKQLSKQILKKLKQADEGSIRAACSLLLNELNNEAC